MIFDPAKHKEEKPMNDKWPWIALIAFMIFIVAIAVFGSGCTSQKLIERHVNKSGVEDISYEHYNGIRTHIYMNDGARIVIPGIHSVSDLCGDGLFEYKRFEEKYGWFLPNDDVHKIECIRGLPEISKNTKDIIE